MGLRPRGKEQLRQAPSANGRPEGKGLDRTQWSQNRVRRLGDEAAAGKGALEGWGARTRAKSRGRVTELSRRGA